MYFEYSSTNIRMSNAMVNSPEIAVPTTPVPPRPCSAGVPAGRTRWKQVERIPSATADHIQSGAAGRTMSGVAHILVGVENILADRCSARERLARRSLFGSAAPGLGAIRRWCPELGTELGGRRCRRHGTSWAGSHTSRTGSSRL